MIHTLDPESTMSVLKDGVTKSIAAYFPLQGRVNTLVADKVYPGDNEIDIDDVHAQKRARLRGRTWAIPIYGDFRLIDNKSGNVVAQAKKVSLVQLPHITRRYSYIVDGAEYQADHQWRLRTGAYSRIKANGELETQFNVEKGKGFRVQFDPVGKKVTMQYGTANLPAYPILRMLGISDDSMKSSWGPELFASASKEPKKGQFLKLAKILDKRAAPTTDEEAAEVIKARLAETKLDPKTTEVTLGKQFSNVTGEAILRASNKLVDINRGVDEPDQRDSLLFKELWNIGDHIPERITNSRMRVINKLRNNVDRKETIREIVSPDIFGVPVKSFFTTTSLAQQTNQTNPIDMIGNHLRTTLMGTGGIGSDNAVSFDAKLTHPSQLGVIDPVHTPEGASSGISTHLALGVSKRGNDPTTRLWDVKGKEWVDRSPLELRKSTVAFADQYSMSDNGTPVARTPSVVVVSPGGGDPKEIPAGQVDYVMRSPKAMFSFAANLVPFLPSVQANRAEMATRHLEQTISLTHREEPIVQSATGAKREDILTWERLLGKSHSMRAKVAGTVTAVDAEKIVVKGADGKSTTTQLYENFPLNEKKTFTHSEPLVKKGDVVKADQVLADTNFTRNGVLAMGVNLRVGYMAFRGGTFEDGLVISESAAEKLRSEHLSKERLFADTDAIFNLKKFRANFPGTITEANAKKLDDDGIIRKGETVGPGDTLIASMRKSEPSPEQVMLKGIHKALAKPFKDLSVSWDRRVTGTVTDVVRNGKETVVYVKTSEVADVGDKLSGRSGNKGIISAVLPDEEMPHDKDGNPLEIIMNFSGVPGRINPAQVLETSVTNAAAKEGKIVVVDNFQPDDAKKLSYANPMGEIHVKGHYRTVKTEEGEKRIWIAPYSYAGKGYHGVVTAALEKSGVSETTELIDPETKKSLGKVLVGYEYVLKHMHQVDKKLNARAHGYGYGYDANMVPRGTGNHDGAQRYGELGMYAMLAHGAVHNIRDSLSYKSDRTADEVWTAVQTGQPLPAPRPSFAYEKFLAYLKGVGLNVEKVGNELKLVPLTDRQVLEMSSGEIKDGAKVLRGKDLRPEDGGLFDIKTTGGPGGKKWSHLALPEPIPNPLFEPAILAILGLTGKEYDGILTANNSLNGATGPGALVAAIEGIEVDKELEKAKGQLKVARRDELNRVNRKIKYLLMLKKNGLTPKDVYVVKNVPVLPPIFRPVTAMESGDLNVDGVNLLYRDISIMSQKLKESRGVLPPAELATLRKDIYDAAAALTGIGGEEGQLTDGSERPAGLLGMITGKVPKTSFFHTKLMDRKQDLTARSVIIPDMSLALDELSIPRKAAAVIYRPFVVKELVQMGYTPLAAKEEIAKDTSLARKALEIAANKRPVLFKRDPVLHSYGIMAFKPRITEGMAIGIHPLLTGGFNADFDGDQMSIFVPLSQDAVEEAYKMLPSKHLFSVSTGKVMYQPTLEGQLGLYLLTQFGKKTNKKFGSDKEAIEAADRGEVSYTDVMNIGGRETTPGRAKVYATLPEKLRSDKYYTDPTFVLGKGNLAKVLTQLGQDTPGDFATSIDKLKNIGFGYAHTSGFSFSLDDFSTLSDIRDKHLLAARKQIAINAVNQRLTPQDREEKAVALYMAADKAIGAEAKVELRRRGSKLLAMNEAGVKPGWDQLKQLVIAPVLLQNAAGRVIPVPVAHSYSEGVSMSDYYIGSEGARKGLIEKVQSVREPGALSKQLINTAIPLVVTSKDCGTAGGLAMDVSSTDIIDRYLSKPVKLSSGETIARGTLVSPAIAAKMMAAKAGRVIVGSPLKCELPKGLCAHCYGADAQGHGIKLGTNIGVISGQSIGERGTQLSMKTFHTGGAAGADSKVVGGLERVTQLLKMPEVLAGKATLAPSTGKIDKVEESTLGGFNVTVGDKHLYVPGGRTLTVKAGDEIRKGDPISSGPIDPRELLALTDMDRVQRYLTDELHGVYADEGVKRRNVEVVIRALTDLGTVDNPGEVGEDAGLTRGDHVGLAFIESLNKKALSEGRKPIEVQPILKGVETLPLDRSTDWLARMQYRRLKETLVRGANEGWSSNIHDVHPVPGLVYSAEFGRKDKTVEGNPY